PVPAKKPKDRNPEKYAPKWQQRAMDAAAAEGKTLTKDDLKKMSKSEQKKLQHKFKGSTRQHADVIGMGNRLFTVALNQMTKPEQEVSLSRWFWYLHRCAQVKIQEVLDGTRGKILDVSQKHDTTRVFQLILKLGTVAQRKEVFDELK